MRSRSAPPVSLRRAGTSGSAGARLARTAILAGLIILAAAKATPPTATETGIAAEVLRLTGGARTKIVWVRSVVPGQGGLNSYEPAVFCIMAFDTDEGKERVLVPGPAGWANPWITSDGSRVVFSRGFAGWKANPDLGEVWVVDWNGKNRRRILSPGFGLCAWTDPKDKTDWVYVSRSWFTSPIHRVKIDKPDVRELVWEKDCSPRFNVSADGTRAGGEFGWPHSGVVNLETRTFKRYGHGCNAYIAPDNSYRFFFMLGNHRVIVMRDEGGVNARRIRVAYKPGGDHANPKWTSNPRFLTVAGTSAKLGVEIHIGRFDEGHTKVEQWVQVTRNGLFDTYAYAWIEPPESAKAQETKKRLAEARKKKEVEKRSWRSAESRAVFLWETADKRVVAFDDKGMRIEGFNLRPRELARLDHNHVMDVRKGSFVAEDAAAHILSSCNKTSSLGIEAYITPADLSGKGPAEIISFSTKDGRRNFALAQKQGELVFGVKTTRQKASWIRLFRLEEKRPCHVIVTYRRGVLVCYRDGRRIMMNTDVKGDLQSWKEGELVFGDNLSGKRNWDGLIEGVVVSASFIEAKEAARSCRNFMALLGERKPVPRLEIVGKLLAKSRAQEYKEIAPYFQELAVYEYEVKRVASGRYAKKRIRVAHWVMMEKKLLPAARAALGMTRRLVLEPFEANRQLEPDFLSNTLPENHDLSLYYDVDR